VVWIKGEDNPRILPMTYDSWSVKAVYLADAEEVDQQRFVKELAAMAYEAQDYMRTHQKNTVHRNTKKVAPTRDEKMMDLHEARSLCDGECKAGSACRKLHDASQKTCDKLVEKLKEKNADTKATQKLLKRDTQDVKTLQDKYDKLHGEYVKECIKSKSAEEALNIIRDLGIGKNDRAMRSPQSPPASKKRGRTKKLSPVRQARSPKTRNDRSRSRSRSRSRERCYDRRRNQSPSEEPKRGRRESRGGSPTQLSPSDNTRSGDNRRSGDNGRSRDNNTKERVFTKEWNRKTGEYDYYQAK